MQAFREEDEGLRDLSFDTISAAAGHAALPHYKVDEDSNIPIPPGSIYLVDSGGQYPGGTTDITRTVWVGPGEPTQEMRDRNTRVLKGHIQIDRAVFPQGTAGGQLDVLARQYLWKQASITPTAPATGSAAFWACTKARSASPSQAAGRPGQGRNCSRA